MPSCISNFSSYRIFFLVLLLLFLNFEKAYTAIKFKEHRAPTSRTLKITEGGSASEGVDCPKLAGDGPKTNGERFTPLDFESHYKPQKSTFSKAWRIVTRKLTPQTHVPKTSTSWSAIYDVGQQASGTEHGKKFPNIQWLIERVISNGSRDSFHSTDTCKNKRWHHLVTCTHRALRYKSLNNLERMWAVGLLSYLKSHAPEKPFSEIPSTPPAQLALSRLMGWGEFDMFLLQDFDLVKLVQQMLEDSIPQDQIPDTTILEAMQRESLISNSLEARQPTVLNPTSPEFDDIFRSFINLQTPINFNHVSLLIGKIGNFLHKDRTPKEGSSAALEEEYSIRILFHLEEHCYQRNLDFKKLIGDPFVCGKMIQLDMKLQLEDASLSTSLKQILQEIKQTTSIHDDTRWVNSTKKNQILKGLKAISSSDATILQKGRLFRLLNFLFQANQRIPRELDLGLNQNSKALSNLAEILLLYHHHQIDPNWFQAIDLQYLIFKKIQEGLAETDRDRMAANLVAKELLLESETTLSLPKGKSDSDEGRERALNEILHPIFKKLSKKLKEQKDRGPSKSLVEQKKDDTKRPMEPKKDDSKIPIDHNKDQADLENLIDYILQLISLKIDDVYFYQQLVHRNYQIVDRLRSKIIELAKGSSCSDHGELASFEKALKKLEKEAIGLGRSWARSLIE